MAGIASNLAQIGITATIAVGSAVYVTRFYGEKWIAARFNSQLESFKHAQQQELEELRFKINSMMDRTAKLYQYEFEAITQI